MSVVLFPTHPSSKKISVQYPGVVPIAILVVLKQCPRIKCDEFFDVAKKLHIYFLHLEKVLVHWDYFAVTVYQ